MKLICKQRLVWEGEYLGIILKVFDCIEADIVDIGVRPWWLATNSTGQTYVYYDKPTLQESGYWSCKGDNTTSFLVAEFDVDDDFDVSTSLLAFQYN